MNKRILRLAIPNIISNISTPLLGLVNIAIVGMLGEDATLAAIAIGTTIFNMIYWICSFIRMGTSGLTAQAFGAENHAEAANILIRSITVAVTIALLMVALQNPIWRFSIGILSGSDRVNELVSEYFFASIWAVPAAISIFGIHGWFIGMQDSKSPMIVSIATNIVNLIFSYVLAIKQGMGIAGVGWSIVIAQYTGVVLSWIIWLTKYREYGKLGSLKESLRLNRLIVFFNINKDIFIRTACLVTAYTFFTAASTRFGDTAIAVNALLMQLFSLFSYMSDGFAYAAESLVGLFVGAKDKVSLKGAIRLLTFWSMGLAIIYVVAYALGWEWLLTLFNASDTIIDNARQYVLWVILYPLAGCVPFLIDGIMFGATQTKPLRNTMLISLAIYFSVYYGFVNVLENNAIWLAFTVFMISRGVLLYIVTDKLNIDKIMKA